MSILRVGGIDISEPAQQHFYDHYIRAQFFSGATSAVLADWVARFKAGRPILVTWENVYDPESKENQVLNPGNVFPAGRRDLAITVFPFVVTGRRYDGHSLVPTVEAVNW